MLIRPVSDLHIDVHWDNKQLYKYQLPELETDKDTVLVIAGDLCELGDGYLYWDQWLRNTCKRFRAVVMIAGNHEHYSGKFGQAIVHLKEVQKLIPNLHVLDNEMVTIDHVHFVGTTFWTNYQNSNPIELIKMQAFSDHMCIEEFPPIKAVEENKKAQEFLRRTVEEIETLGRPGDKIYVVTHQSPSILSEDPRYRDSPISSAFSSALEELVYDIGADIWHHGHIHMFSDYELFGTRMLCNAKGYETPSGIERTFFKDKLVIEV